jgi:urea carboxylase
MASVWKIPASKGSIIQDADEILVILEAMKTEIPVKAGKSNVGRTVAAYGKGMKEGALVQPGDTLLLLC